jgi:hypothetical protein
MNKKTTMIIGLQAILIVTLFWMLVFYGKDEFDTAQETREEEIETPSRVSDKQGISIVTISPEVQNNSGIQTAKIRAANYTGEIKSFGNVVGIDSLIDAKTQYLNLRSEMSVIQSTSSHNLQQYQRLKTLNTDDKNVSDRAVQESLALVNADKAKIQGLELQVKNLLSNMKLKWGESLTNLITEDKLPAHLQGLMNRKYVLVQASLPINTPTPEIGSIIQITPINENIQPIPATYISPATQSDASGLGKTYYYSAPADLLRIGMRVNVQATAKAPTSNGVVIPNSAVVWYAGTPWIYLKQGKQQFLRKPISTDTEVDSGWFNQNISTDSEIVTRGAQLLLSEEFKYQIKNENED